MSHKVADPSKEKEDKSFQRRSPPWCNVSLTGGDRHLTLNQVICYKVVIDGCGVSIF